MSELDHERAIVEHEASWAYVQFAQGSTARPLTLFGPRGEPVDLRLCLLGHGVTDLPPMRPDVVSGRLDVTLRPRGYPPRLVRITQSQPVTGSILAAGSAPCIHEWHAIEAGIRHILRLDEDLSEFYALAANDARLSWVAQGAGRFTRCQSVFEEIIKTICTTNCNWGATVKMTAALVRELGEPVPGAPQNSWEGRAFPTAAAMAAADEPYYRQTIRCGYRGPHLATIARRAHSGELELEDFGRISAEELADDDLATALLALPGVGPYAAAHIMLMLGRYSRLVLDSWTRPSYAKLVGRDAVPDTEIVEAFSTYGRFAGLAFWLTVTRDWYVVAA